MVKNALRRLVLDSKRLCYCCGTSCSKRWIHNRDPSNNFLCRHCYEWIRGRNKYLTLEAQGKAVSIRLKGHKFNLGRKLSAEHKEKLRIKSLGNLSRTGMKASEYQKQRARQFMLGRPSPTRGITLSEERKKLYSIMFSGKNNPNYGNRYSEEIREKIRLARLHYHLPFKDTTIEVALQKALTEKGIAFEKHKPIFGQPDIFIKPNICIFADGDYWHRIPKTIVRDKLVNVTLQLMGYKILRFWEHDIKQRLEWCIQQIQGIL